MGCVRILETLPPLTRGTVRTVSRRGRHIFSEKHPDNGRSDRTPWDPPDAECTILRWSQEEPEDQAVAMNT